jgi:diaminopimelate epimerase
MKILVVDPAGNITVFVLDPVKNLEERAALARAILSDSEIKAEQVGFVIPFAGPGNSLWRLEMMGGEFCGNAARSFGLYAARAQGLKGKTKVFVYVSGAEDPVQVEVDVEKGWAAAEMPKPLAVESLAYKGRSLALLAFEGITHVIAPDLKSVSENFYAIMSLAKEKFPAAAFGVMFYDTSSRFMVPMVYVKATDTTVLESSCGSGSAALGVWLSREMLSGTAKYAIAQSGGVIETTLVKSAGKISSITIGGEVILGETKEFFYGDLAWSVNTPENHSSIS